jgi:competence protein ComEA
MVSIGKPLLVVYIAAALAIALIGARYLNSAGEPGDSRVEASFVPGTGTSDGSDARGSPSASTSARRLVLHVTGAVRRPGLVKVRDGDRVGDAIQLAGGAARGADLTAVNLAMRVADGQQVVVPTRRTGAAIGAGASAGGGPISLNAATIEQLDTLEGVGPGLAGRIVAERERRGGFRSVDDLSDVPGIGEKRLESLRAQLQP